MEFLGILQGLIPLIAPSLVFAACLYYLILVRSADSILLSVGAGTGLIMTASFTYMPYYAQTRALSMNNLSSYYAIGGFVSLLGTILFSVGLFMLIDKVIKLTRKNNPEKNHYQP